MTTNRILLATRKGLLTITKGRSGWKVAHEAHGGARLSYAMADSRSGYLFACFDHGHWGVKLKRSKDEGQSWDEIPAPAYPEGEVIKPGKPAVLLYLWCLVEGQAQRPGRLYAGTVPGALFQTDDHGDSWQIVRSLWDHPSRQEQWFGGGMNEPGIHSLLLDPRQPDEALVGISCAGVFAGNLGERSADAWTVHNQGLVADFLPNPHAEIGHDVHFMAQCQSEPDVLWQQNHCGIFRSTDRGRTWLALSKKGETPHFGFVVAASETDPLTAWVVPAETDEVRAAVERKLCVCRTDDGGQSWKTFRQGLPQEQCYDFVFRHGLDNRGDQLAMGTAGGSCYISDDRGESWQTVGNHLPPIYSVRFA
jgi:photosystem II stability/assembly factor-like uncharacterized protein